MVRRRTHRQHPNPRADHHNKSHDHIRHLQRLELRVTDKHNLLFFIVLIYLFIYLFI
jgi:hypothetical protein